MTATQSDTQADEPRAKAAIHLVPEPDHGGGIPALVWASLLVLIVVGAVLWQMHGR
ncbi:MAG: hypothetical protein AAF607_03790 [Pseudomonadota bacterium]